MAGRAGQKIKLTSIDELLCVPETEGTIDLDVRAIYPFENHPFKVLDDEKMDELVESIKANGVLTPVLVRPDDEGTYEMISGHRRLHAAKRAGLFRIPAIVKEMTNDDAVIAMVDANVQREEVLPSEKAFAFRMKFDAIRLTELIPKLLDMVDEKRLALSVAVELSYMNKNVQQWIYEFIRENGMIKQEQLMELRKYRDDKNMTQEQLITILIGSTSTVPVSKKITLNERKLHKFFPAYYSKAEMERVIFGLLEQWKQAQDSEEN